MSEKFIVEGGLKLSSGTSLEIGDSTLDGIKSTGTLVGTEAAKKVIPSEYSVKTYVDDQIHGPVRIKVGGTDYDVNTETEYIGYAGTANEVNVSFAESDAGQTDNEAVLTIGLPASVDITTDLEVATLDFATGSIKDSTGAISFDNENLSTTGTLAAGNTDITGTADVSGAFSAGASSLGATTISGTVSSSGNADFAGTLNVDGTITGNTSLTLDTTTITTAELGLLDGLTNGTAAASKVMSWKSDSTWTAAGGTCADLGIVTTMDLNGGSIDGATIATSDVTVGASKTLDVSAGTLTTSAAQKEAILEGLADDADPDLGNNVLTAESYVSDVATGTAPLVVASTTKVANLNADLLDGMTTIDEDNMVSNSATALPTQQSVKKYVDDQIHGPLNVKVGGTDYDINTEDEYLGFAGTSNEIDVAFAESSAGNADNEAVLTIGLPASVDITTDLEVSTLDFATGSIKDSTGAISFDNENLSTSGTLAAGATTVTGAMSASGAVTGGSIVVGSADMSETDLEKLDGITNGTVAASKAVVVDASLDASGFRNVTATGSFIIGSASMDETDLEKLDGITNGTVAASKAVVVDANKDADGFRNVTATGSFIIGNASMNETDLEKLDGITNGTAAASKAMVTDGSNNIASLGTLGCGAITSTGSSQVADLTITGAASLNGNVGLGNAQGDELTFTGRSVSDFLPKTDSTYDLGSSNVRWNEVHCDEVIGGADNMLIFAQDSGDSATEHSFDSEDGVLVLQAADYIDVVSDFRPYADSSTKLGSSSMRWSEVHNDSMVMEHSARKDFSVTPTGAAETVLTFADADYKSAKIVCSISSGTNQTSSEVLIASHNSTCKTVEYAKISIGTEIAMTWAATSDGTTTTVTCDSTGALKGSYDLIA